MEVACLDEVISILNREMKDTGLEFYPFKVTSANNNEECRCMTSIPPLLTGWLV